METKKETNSNAGETVFELTPEKITSSKTKSRINKIFSRDFFTGFLAAGVICFLTLALAFGPIIKNWSALKPITIEQAKAKAEDFINNNLLKPGNKIAIKGAEDKNGIYKIVINTGTEKDIDTYITKDGKIFFPQAIDIEKAEKDKKNGAESDPSAAPKTELKKNDKPEVELFVMSHCPYGTQIEKGILPAIKTLGSKISFDIKFTDYAMHGEKELKEELAQYCIKSGEPAKFTTYLNCFLEDGDSARCQTKAAINAAKLKTCVAAADAKYKVTENFNDPAKKEWKGSYPPFNIYKDVNAKYGVQGSPTLVINGATVNSGRDSASLLKTICSAFNAAPKECEASLSAVAPAAGFGTGAAASSGSASCGN